MSKSRSNATRRKRTASTEVSSSHKTGSSGKLSAVLSISVILAASAYLMAHDQVDEALGRTATVISDKSTTTGQVWTSVVTTFATEDGEEDLANETSTPDLTMLKDGDRVTAGSQDRSVTTSGNDLLRLEPKTTITIGEQKPATDHRTARRHAARQSRQAPGRRHAFDRDAVSGGDRQGHGVHGGGDG